MAVDPTVLSRYLSPPAGLTNGIDPLVMRQLQKNATDQSNLYAGQPPVIGDIAKAYTNDPRTQLAINAIKTGTSTDPVARGKYGIADGIARALTGVTGSWVNQQQEAKYGKEQQDTLDTRAANAQDPLTGASTATTASTPGATPGVDLSNIIASTGGGNGIPASTGPAPTASPDPASASVPSTPSAPPPSTPTGVNPQLASAIAAAATGNAPPVLGGPQPGATGAAGGPSGLIGGLQPNAPPLPPPGPPPGPAGSGFAPIAPTGTGGSPNINNPFPSPGGPVSTQVPGGPTSNVPVDTPTASAALAGGTGATQHAATPANIKMGKFDVAPPTIPDAPPAPVEPTAPTAIPARQSTLLTAARNIALSKNPYDSDRGQEMYAQGLKEQDALNQAADDRAQKIVDDKYGTEREIYAHNTGAQYDAKIQERAAAQKQYSDTILANANRAAEADNLQKQLANQVLTANIGAGATLGSARIGAQASKYSADQLRASKLEDIQATVLAKRQNWLQNQGAKPLAQAQKSIQAGNHTLDLIDQYDKVLQNASTARGGGFVGTFAPKVLDWSDPNRQTISGLSNNLALAQQDAGAANGIRGTNMILKTILASKPGLSDTIAVQHTKLMNLKDAVQRANDYQTESLQAQADGNALPFQRQYNQYELETRGQVGKNGDPVFTPFSQWAARQPAYNLAGNRTR